MSIGSDQLFLDQFTGSGSLGANWTVTGSLSKGSGVASGTGSAVLASASNFDNANYKVSADLGGFYAYSEDDGSGNTYYYAGGAADIYARKTASNTYYKVELFGTTDYASFAAISITLYKVVSGSTTTLASTAIGGISKIEFRLDGSSLSVWTDATGTLAQTLSATDSSITGIGVPGFGNVTSIDNFTVTGTASGGGSAQTLTPSLYTNSASFYTPTVTKGAVTLSPSLYSDGDTFYSATVAAGTVTLTPALYSDGDTFYSATVSQAASSQSLTPSLFTNYNRFHVGTLVGGGTSFLFGPDDFNRSGLGSNYTAISGTITCSTSDPRATGSGTVRLTSNTGFSSNYTSEFDTSIKSNSGTGTKVVVYSRYLDANNYVKFSIDSTNSYQGSWFARISGSNSASGLLTILPSDWDSGTDWEITHVTLSVSGETYKLYTSGTYNGGASFSNYLANTRTITGYSSTGYPAFALGSVYVDNFTVTGSASATLSAPLYSDDDTFYAPVVSQADGSQTLLPSLYSDADTFYSATVTSIRYLAAGLYADDDTFYSATVMQAQILAPSLYSDADTFYSATVAVTGGLFPALYEDADTFYAASISTRNTLLPDMYLNLGTFYAPAVSSSYALSPALLSDGDTFYSAKITYTLLPDLFSDGDAFYAPAVSAGAVTLSPALFADGDTFYTPVIQIDTLQRVLPPLYADADTFYAATISPGAVTLLPGLFVNSSVYYGGLVLGGDRINDLPPRSRLFSPGNLTGRA